MLIYTCMIRYFIIYSEWDHKSLNLIFSKKKFKKNFLVNANSNCKEVKTIFTSQLNPFNIAASNVSSIYAQSINEAVGQLLAQNTLDINLLCVLYLSILKSNRMSVCLYVCLFFVCSLNPPKKWTLMSWNFEGWFPLGCRCFEAKKTSGFDQPFGGKPKKR